MILDGIFFALGSLMRWVAGLLPVGTLTLPSAADVGTWIGTYGGPFDKVIPLHEAVLFAVILLTVWVPSMVVYTLTLWAYKHLPVLGKG